MKFLVSSATTVIQVEAETLDLAYALALPTLLATPYDKQHGNMVGVQEPETPEGWKELERRLIVSTGDFFEHFGYPDSYGTCLLDRVRKGPEA